MGDCACDVFTGETKIPVFFLELTFACNNACVGCSNVFSHQSNPPPLDYEGWHRVLERLAPTAAWFKITGGEPTLHPEFEAIIKDIDALGIPFTLFTNARWQEPKRLVSFLKSIPTLHGLLISLHGPDAFSHEAFTCTPGSFEETVANIRLATEAGLRVSTSTVITRYNWNRIGEIVAFSKELGARQAVFNRFIGSPLPQIEPTPLQFIKAVETFEALRAQGTSIRWGNPVPNCLAPNSSGVCMAGDAMATVDPWGNVRPCNHAPMIVGNLLTQSLEEVWLSSGMEKWRSARPPQCLKCSEFPSCYGWCRAELMYKEAILLKSQEPALQDASTF